MTKTPLMRLIEMEKGKSIDHLIKEGRESGMTWTEVARWLAVPYATLMGWRRARGMREERTVYFASEETAQ